MDASENLLDGCEEVALKCIDNGGFIWVNKLPCPNFVFQKEVLECSSDFKVQKKYKDKAKHENFEIIKGKRYAVKNGINAWYRGDIISVKDGNYKVFLVDQGLFTTVLRESILPLPENLIDIPPLAYRISFYGIKPVCMQFSDDLLTFEKKECENWQPAHVSFLSEVLKRANKIYFKEVTKLKEVVYGVVFVQNEKEFIILNNELCEKGLAEKVARFEEVSKKLLVLVGRKTRNLCKDSDEEPSKELKSKTDISLSKSEDLKVISKRKSSDSSGSLPITSREYLLKVAFGVKVCHAKVDASENSHSYGKKFEESGSDIGQSENESDIKQLGNRSADQILICRNDVKELESTSDNKLNVFSRSNISSELSDSASESFDSLSDLNNCKSSRKNLNIMEKFDSSSEEHKRKPSFRSKPMSPRVMMLYEKSSKFKKENSISSASESSNYESDENAKEKSKKRYENKFYAGALLHQSPSIAEEIEPYERLIDCDVNQHIRSMLECRQRRDLTQLQMYAYPVLLKHHNLIIVSNPSSGKTLASVVAVLSLLSDEKSYEGLSRGFGPKAIFLTSFANNVGYIEKMCRTLLSSQKNIVVKSAFGGDAVDKKKCELGEGCDVLITTPRCLLRLLKVRFVINVERLCHLIFDDGDFIFSNFLPEVKELVKLISVLEEKRKPESKYKKVQKIVLSERWFPVLGSFVKDVVKDGFICIPMHNLLEAAVYSNIKPNIQFLKPENKCNVLIDFVKSERGTLRSVIVAKDKEETLELQNKLDPVCGRLLVAHEGMHHVAVDSIKRAWMENVEGVHAVMICTDDVMSDLSITNADILIHYSLPSTKTLFSSRFVCLLEKYNNIFRKETSPSCKVYIFVDEDNDEQFPEIVSLMERLKFPVSEKIQNVVMRINLQKEASKKEKKLCENLKQFGNCWKEGKCHYRHVILPEVDEIDGFPKTGHVKLKVIYRHDASHLSCLLIERKVGKVWQKLPSIERCSIISFKMASYFDNEDDRSLHYRPKIGDLIAIEGEGGAFQRACVIELLKFDDKRNPTDVRIKLLETGAEYKVKALDLYSLPEELKKESPQAVDIYLCRLQPTDLDKYWSFSADKLVDQWLLETERAVCNYGESHYLCGRIVLSVGRNLWLDPLTHSEWLESTNTEIYHCSFRHDLIKKNLAVEKSDHLELLHKLCSSSGLNIPKPENLSLRIEEFTSQGQWAHLNRDEFTDVFVIFATNPEKVFLRNVKFADRLYELEKDISKLDKVQVLKKGELKVGELCLALYPDDNTWSRAKIISLKSEDEVEVFYADYGDFGTLSWDQLAKIPADLVGRLPFQAIECRLAGVQPINENCWSESSVNLLYKLAEMDDGMWKTLTVYVYDLELKAEITGGRKYSVALLDIEQDPVILLNKELVIQGEANWRTEERNWLDDVINKYMTEINKSSFQNEVVDESIIVEEEDWDKMEVNTNNNNTVGLVRSSADTETESEYPSSIVDKHLKELFENDDNVEIINPKAFICEALDLPLHLFENRSEKKLKALPEPKKKSPVITLLTDENSMSASETESELSIPKAKPDIYPLLKCKPSVLTLPKRRVVVSPSNDIKEPTNGNTLSDKSVSRDKCKMSMNKNNKKPSNFFKKTNNTSDSGRFSTTSDADDLSDPEDCLLKDGPPPLKQVGHCYTPLVYWYQNLEFVWLQISLIGVKKYSIKWTLRTIIFSTWLDEKYYRLDLSLFGPIYPETLQHSAKGFFVEIKMKKVLAGVNWSRLLQSKSRYNWLKTNLEHVIRDNSDDEMSKKGEGNCTKKSDYSQSIFGPRPPGLSDSDSSSSDIVDFKDVEDDPDDPFNITAPADSD